ncbi:MAG: phosphoribosylformylglycinamidine synthase subunit PurQ [Candidatus Pelagibacterales bacterium]|jgi:phosphoribosylformylglycinamidine synthase|tara:strand:- start:3619 stop:4290 length:672 start_codon:yes stop_codon:yes gene_type:complete
MKSKVIVFPGSNCDRDVAVAIKQISGSEPQMVWHKETSLSNSDLIIVPGGFSYGDYLRCGAIASTSPIINEVVKKANEGVPVIGICNGFQILIETSLLDGALIRNNSLSFICRDVYIKSENQTSIFTKKTNIAKMPIAHNEGNYFASDETLKKIVGNDQVAFKYCNQEGEVTSQSNPNGSLENIAGILNDRKNVLGLMPHPERAAESALGCEDGKYIFESILS